MKVILCASLALLSVTSVAFGSNKNGSPARDIEGCGSSGTKYSAQKSERHPVLDPKDGQAAIYVFSKLDYGGVLVGCQVISRIGLDGKWIGANCATSYVVTAIQPGAHKLCADWQSSYQTKLPFGTQPLPALTSFEAQPGQSYYFSARILYEKGIADISLEPIDPTEGRLLVAATPASTSKAKN